MADTPNPTRKLVAGVAAVVLTLAAAGAAVAVNLDTAREIDTPAGDLTATELVGDETTPSLVTPSTIYLDVPFPADPGPAPAVSPTPVPMTGAGSAPHGDDGDDDSYELGDDDHEDDHEDGADDDD